jgi:tetratricopeptide (TPR) repeat protein
LITHKQALPVLPFLATGLVLSAAIIFFFYSRYRQAAELAAWITKGQSAYDQKHYADAIAAYQKALELDPPTGSKNVSGTKSNLRWRIGANYADQGLAEFNQAQYIQSENDYERALQYDPGNGLYEFSIRTVQGRLKDIADQNAAVKRRHDEQQRQDAALQRDLNALASSSSSQSSSTSLSTQGQDNALELSGNKMAYDKGMGSSDPSEVKSQIDYLQMSASSYPPETRGKLDHWIENLQGHLARLKEREHF